MTIISDSISYWRDVALLGSDFRKNAQFYIAAHLWSYTDVMHKLFPKLKFDIVVSDVRDFGKRLLK